METRNCYKNTLKRALLIKALTDEYYEPGNQSKSYKNVWRLYVCPVYPMDYRTFLRYLKIAEENN